MFINLLRKCRTRILLRTGLCRAGETLIASDLGISLAHTSTALTPLHLNNNFAKIRTFHISN